MTYVNHVYHSAIKRRCQPFLPLIATGRRWIVTSRRRRSALARKEAGRGRDPSARGRVGWANGHVLLYLTGGAAFAQVSAWANDSATTSFFANFVNEGFEQILLGTATDTNVSRNSDILVGWTGGGGGEYAFNDMVSVGVEYRRSDFGDHTFGFAANGGPIFPGPTKIDLQTDQVTVRFNILLSSFFGH